MKLPSFFSLSLLASRLAASLDLRAATVLTQEQKDAFHLACKSHNLQNVTALLPQVVQAGDVDQIVLCMQQNSGYSYKPIFKILVCTETVLHRQFSGKSNEERNALLVTFTTLIGPNQIHDLQFLDLLMDSQWSELTAFIRTSRNCLFDPPAVKFSILRGALQNESLNPSFFLQLNRYKNHLFSQADGQNDDVCIIMAHFLQGETKPLVDDSKALQRLRERNDKPHVQSFLQKRINQLPSFKDLEHTLGRRSRFTQETSCIRMTYISHIISL